MMGKLKNLLMLKSEGKVYQELLKEKVVLRRKFLVWQKWKEFKKIFESQERNNYFSNRSNLKFSNLPISLIKNYFFKSWKKIKLMKWDQV